MPLFCHISSHLSMAFYTFFRLFALLFFLFHSIICRVVRLFWFFVLLRFTLTLETCIVTPILWTCQYTNNSSIYNNTHLTLSQYFLGLPEGTYPIPFFMRLRFILIFHIHLLCIYILLDALLDESFNNQYP
jgi:hypothetical protein